MAELGVIQELRQCFRKSVAAFLENVFDVLTDPFVEQLVKIGNGEVFIDVKTKLDRKIGWIFRGERSECQSEKRCFTGLARCEKDDVPSILHSVDEIFNFFSAEDAIMPVRLHCALGAKRSHFLTFVANVFRNFRCFQQNSRNLHV